MTTIPVGHELDRAVGEAMGAEPVGWRLYLPNGVIAGYLYPSKNAAKEARKTWVNAHPELQAAVALTTFPTYSTDHAGPVLEWLANAEHAEPNLEHDNFNQSWMCCAYRFGLCHTGEGATWQEAVCRAALALHATGTSGT